MLTNIPPPIIPDKPLGVLINGYDTPAEEATKPSIVLDSRGPIRSTAPERYLPSPAYSPAFSIEAGVPMSLGGPELSPAETALIALRWADEAQKPIDRANTWKGAISRIKWVMDTVSPIAEVRAISILPLLD